jgi:FtsP/CotA-like multicopper oxidase with cupredoxin domain
MTPMREADAQNGNDRRAAFGPGSMRQQGEHAMPSTLMRRALGLLLGVCLLALAVPAARAAVIVQCPGDNNGDADLVDVGDTPDPDRVVRCMHLTGGDGYAVMADGRRQYTFGFHDLTGTAIGQVINEGRMKANWPAPLIARDEGDEFFLTLTNVGMVQRPDLFDAHSVHFHGFPNSSSIFDGLPESSFGINMMSSLTYYYNVVKAGTYMYHCHIEATEHMQMGMLGNLYVRPAQNRYPDGHPLGALPAGKGAAHVNGDYALNPNQDDPLVGYKYAYNDGDGSTYYDVEYPIMMGGFDSNFHDADEFVQPLNFADLEDNYTMLNGRGYPDTVNTAPGAIVNVNGFEAQKTPSLISVNSGQIILLRIVNLNVTHFWGLSALGLPMKVIAHDADLLQTADGSQKLYYLTNSVTIGGGGSVDVLIDTTGLPTGTYPLYSTLLDHLSNPSEDFGGMMTEIRIN